MHTFSQKNLGMSAKVCDIAVYVGDKVYLACGDYGLGRYKIKY